MVWDNVALRKESVDRNFLPSAKIWRTKVALRKESVDRNAQTFGNLLRQIGRSPQGERG